MPSGGSVPTCTMVPPFRVASRQLISAAGLPATSSATSTSPMASASDVPAGSLSTRRPTSAPMLFATASGLSTTSVTMTLTAPKSFAASTVMQPMVPAPVTSTVLPTSGVPIRLTECRPTENGSQQASSPSVTSPATGVNWRSPIRKYSRNMPWTCGKMLALPRKRISRQRFSRPSRQLSHLPQGCDGLIATLSPSLTRATPAPTLATTPEASCPGVIGSRIWKLPTRPSKK